MALTAAFASAQVKLLNVSYDPTREFYAEYNAAFSKYWKSKAGKDVTIDQSHGGSGKQARSVIDGLEADVVTLALSDDIDSISLKSGFVSPGWQQRLPDNSSPYTSTIVLLVRKGNPKGIKDWDDLVKAGVSVITPNPKTGGGARWNYLAAWAFALKKFKGDETLVKEFISSLYRNVPVLDSGARGSMTTFAKNRIGDVLISWENEAFLAQKEFAADGYEIITPSVSILAEPSVAVVDKNAARKGNTEVATEYLQYLYSPEGQDLAGKHFYRPRDPKAAAKYGSIFVKTNLVTIDKDFGGWSAAQKKHFGDGGIFDQIYQK